MTLSSLVAPEVVVMTTYCATSDYKVGIMTALGFHCSDDMISVGLSHSEQELRSILPKRFKSQFNLMKI